VPALVDGHGADDGEVAMPGVVHAEEVSQGCLSPLGMVGGR
jgi:hypothetical protein